MWIADGWKDYELLDCGGGEKLERWDKQILVQPFLQRRRPLGQGEAAGELAHPL